MILLKKEAINGYSALRDHVFVDAYRYFEYGDTPKFKFGYPYLISLIRLHFKDSYCESTREEMLFASDVFNMLSADSEFKYNIRFNVKNYKFEVSQND